MAESLVVVRKPSGVARVRILIYGIEGVGKSTFGIHAPDPVVIGPEGGTDELRLPSGETVPEMPGCNTFEGILQAVDDLLLKKHSFKTLVIDSADWVEKLAHAHIIGDKGKSIITVNGGYGAGYRESESLHRQLIAKLQLLRTRLGMNVVVTAHYHVRTVKDPEAIQDYDAFEPKCHEFVNSLWKEWVDAIFFARFETLVKKEEDKDKGRAFGTGKRVMYTEKRPAFAAKNRYGLPFELPVSWDAFNKARIKSLKSETIESVRADLDRLAKSMKEPDAAKMNAAIAKGPGDIEHLMKIRTHAQKLAEV